jgi:hypothetical protein
MAWRASGSAVIDAPCPPAAAMAMARVLIALLYIIERLALLGLSRGWLVVLEHTKVLAELDKWSQLVVHLNPDLTDVSGILATIVIVLVNCEL